MKSRPSGGFGPRGAPVIVPDPPGFSTRRVAADILADAVIRGRPPEERLGNPRLDPRLAALDARDVALVRSITMVALRRLGTIRKALAALMDKPPPRKAAALEWILVVAAAQIMFLETPDHAPVTLAVHAAKTDPSLAPYAGLTNAVLRNLTQRKDEWIETSDPLDDDTPPWLAARWRANYGDATARAFARAHRDEPTLDVTVKSDPEAWAVRLGGLLLPTGSIRVESHRPVSDMDGYAEGEWWVQDAAAALPAKFLRAGPGMRVLDLCAAPGGKSAQLAAAGAAVTCLDRSAERLKRLAENFSRLRLQSDVVVSDALNYRAQPFDAVLLDAPCSATGTIRRHPDVAWTKRADHIPGLAELQGRLLDAAFALTKPGGLLVYCTCSLEPEEGEGAVRAFQRRTPDARIEPIEADEIGGLTECLDVQGNLRTLPTALPAATSRLSGLDGFFAARFRRRA